MLNDPADRNVTARIVSKSAGLDWQSVLQPPPTPGICSVCQKCSIRSPDRYQIDRLARSLRDEGKICECLLEPYCKFQQNSETSGFLDPSDCPKTELSGCVPERGEIATWRGDFAT